MAATIIIGVSALFFVCLAFYRIIKKKDGGCSGCCQHCNNPLCKNSEKELNPNEEDNNTYEKDNIT